MRSLLNVVWDWASYINEYVPDSDGTKEILTQVFDIISLVLWIVLAVVGAVGAIYAIFLGIKLARAEEQGKRDDAKKHLITVCIAIGVTLALILVFNTFMPALISAFQVAPGIDINNPGGTGTGSGS